MAESSPELALVCELISRRSLTPDDAGCCEVLAARLAPLGVSLEWLTHEGVTNLWATRGQGGPMVVLAGHTDVVPAGPRDHWHTDPFYPTILDGVLYGRGAADMKAGLAAMVCAVERLVAEDATRGTIAFLVTSDEEGACRHGTRHVVAQLRERGVRPEYAIVGEATAAAQLGDRIAIGRRGSLGCDLKVIGTQGHVAYPQKADNPIHRLVAALAELKAMRWDDGNAQFPPTSFQVSNVRAGTGANNVIPGEADCVFNFRYSTESTADDLRARTEAVLAKHLLRHEARWWHSGEPYFTAPGRLIDAATAAIVEITGRTPEQFTGGGTSDGRFIATLGTEVVEIGPVNTTIHQVNECVQIDDLPRLSQIYQRVLARLLAP